MLAMRPTVWGSKLLVAGTLAMAACGGSSTRHLTSGTDDGDPGDQGTAGIAAGRSSTETSSSAGTGGMSTGGAGTNTGAGIGGLEPSGAAGNVTAVTSGAGGTAGVGSAGIGGSSASAGTGYSAGQCASFDCVPAVIISVTSDPSSNGSVIQNLKVDSPLLDLSCSTEPGSLCSWLCQSAAYAGAPAGDYSVTITADGYEPATVDFTVPAGCCPRVPDRSVLLVPAGAPPTAGCCADLDDDPTNCGTCGRTCPGGRCAEGTCSPTFLQCLVSGEQPYTGVVYQTCDDFCASVGQVCSASCGYDSNEASEEWFDSLNCYDDTEMGVTPVLHGCSDVFEAQGPNGETPSFKCCCGDPSP